MDLKNLFKNKYVWLIIIFILLFPIAVNIIFFSWRSSVAFGKLDTWIGFFATYYGAIFGGVISGALTLIGVKLTIDQQTKIFERQEEKYAEDKYNTAQYIRGEVFHLIIGVQNSIKSFTNENYNENIMTVYERAEQLDKVSNNLLPQASNISASLLNSLKTISWAAQDIKEFIDESKEKDFDQKWVVNELLNGRFYQRLAVADETFFNTINSIKLNSEKR